jgi:hypothetical protein
MIKLIPPKNVINKQATGVQYASYVWHDGFVSTFCMSNPHHVDWGGTADPKFSFIMNDGTGWRWEEHLNIRALQDGITPVNWVTKAHANVGSEIWFSTGSPGQPDHDGGFPIFPDGHGRYWRLLNPRRGPGELCAFDLVEYIPA